MDSKTIALSGTMGFGGGYPFKPLKHEMFDMITTKTVTLYPIKQKSINPVKFVKPINYKGKVDYFNDSGVVNSVGMANKGLFNWIEEYSEKKYVNKIILSYSINDDVMEFVTFLNKIEKLEIYGIEPNFSCSNIPWHLSDEAIIETIREIYDNTNKKISLKLDLYSDYMKIISEVGDLVEMINFNSVSWEKVFNTSSPIGCPASVSGKLIQLKVLNAITQISKITSTPIITSSIWELGDWEMMKNFGATHLGIGSVSFLHSFRAKKIIEGAKHGI